MNTAVETRAAIDSGPSWTLTRTHRIHGVGRLRYERASDRTRLADLYHRDPVRFLFPRVAADEASTAVLVTTSGGLVGGDRLDVQVEGGKDAQALVLTQAAEKVYGSGGPDSMVTARFCVGKGACLEWLPQETILFQHSRLRRSTTIDLGPGGRFLGGEILVFGRSAYEETLSDGLLSDRWELHRQGRLCWVDVMRLDRRSMPALSEAAGFAGARAYGVIVYACEGAVSRLDTARALLPPDDALQCAATVVGDALIVRWLSADPFILRRAYGRFWAAFRHAELGRPNRLPRLWDI